MTGARPTFGKRDVIPFRRVLLLLILLVEAMTMVYQTPWRPWRLMLCANVKMARGGFCRMAQSTVE
jgi:hypothetical protein